MMMRKLGGEATTHFGAALLAGAVLGLLSLGGCSKAPGSTAEAPRRTPATGVVQSTPAPETAAEDGAREARLDMVRRSLERGYDVNKADATGRTALMMAAFEGHRDVVQLLLDHGAAVDQRDGAGRPALMYAASGPYPGIVELLLERGASVDLVESEEGWTALMFAAGEGHRPVVEVLLDHGANPEIADSDGDTAADHARERGHEDLARLLEPSPAP
jgi:ankyrin repeat protein